MNEGSYYQPFILDDNLEGPRLHGIQQLLLA